jgi:hypothetical protein
MTEAAFASRDCSSTQVYVPDQAFTHLALSSHWADRRHGCWPGWPRG